MKIDGNGHLLRIFIGEADRIGHKPLYEALVLKAHELGLAGTTVLRGVEGFGANSRAVHTAKILRLSENLPLVLELIDSEEKISSFLPIAKDMLEGSGGGGLMTLEQVHYVAVRAVTSS